MIATMTEHERKVKRVTDRLKKEKLDKKVKAVILDIDDTLVDTSYLVQDMRLAACEAVLYNNSVPEKLNAVLVEKFQNNPRKMLNYYDFIAKTKGSNYGEHLDDIFVLMKAYKNVSRRVWKKYVVKPGAQAYHEKRDGIITPNGELATLLEILDQMNIFTGIVSCAKFREKQLKKLELLGLLRFFNDEDIIVIESTMEGNREVYGNKAEGLRQVLEQKGISPEFAVYEGDTQKDNIAAHRAGMRFLFHSNPRGRHATRYLEELAYKDIKPSPSALIENVVEDTLDYVNKCNQ